jgi:hypothetical protein
MERQPLEAELAGRTVELRQCGCGVAFQSNTIRTETGDNFLAASVVLAASAFWKDDGARVFRDGQAVMEWPMCDLREIMALIQLSQTINEPRGIVATTNGSGEAAAPAPSH